MSLIPLLFALAARGAPLDLGAIPGSGPSAPSGPTVTPATACIRSLDFLMEGDLARVIVGLGNEPSGEVSLTWREVDPRTFVVQLPGGAAPSSLLRPLDTSSFPSTVSGVEVHDRDWGCEVQVRLRNPVGWHVSREGTHLVLDFPSPIDATFPTATTIRSSTALTGAYSSEVLIDARGRTWDPSKVLAPESALPLGDSPVMGWDAVAAGYTSTAPRISVDLVNADIHNVLRLFADVGHINVVAGDDVAGRVTVRLTDVPWDQALAAVLASLHLGACSFGDRIVTVKQLE